MATKYRIQIGYRNAGNDYTHVGQTAFSRDHDTFDDLLKEKDFFVDRINPDGQDDNYISNYTENILPGTYGAFWGHPEFYYALVEVTNAEYEELVPILGTPYVSYSNGKWLRLTLPEKQSYVSNTSVLAGTYSRAGDFEFHMRFSYGAIGVLNDKSNPEEDLNGAVYIQNVHQKIDDKQTSSYGFDTYDFYVNVRGGRDFHVEVAAGTTAYAVAGTNLKNANQFILTHPSTWASGLMSHWDEAQFTDRYNYMWQTRFEALSATQVGDIRTPWMLPSPWFSSVSSAVQVSAMAKVSADWLNGLSSTGVANLTTTQIAIIGTEYGGSQSWKLYKKGADTGDTKTAKHAAWFEIKQNFLQALSSTQLGAIQKPEDQFNYGWLTSSNEFLSMSELVAMGVDSNNIPKSLSEARTYTNANGEIHSLAAGQRVGNLSAWGWFTGEQVAALTFDWSRVSGKQLNAMRASVFAKLNTKSLALLSTEALALLDDEHTKVLTPERLALLSTTQIAALKHLELLINDPTKVPLMLTALSPVQWGAIHESVWAKVDFTQTFDYLGNITNLMGAMTIEQFSALPEGFFRALASTRLEGLNYYGLMRLSANSLFALIQARSQLPSQSFDESNPKIPALLARVLLGLNYRQLSNVSATNSLRANLYAGLIDEYTQSQTIVENGIARLSAEAMSHWSNVSSRFLNHYPLGLIHAAGNTLQSGIATLSAAALVALPDKILLELDQRVLRSFTSSQIQGMGLKQALRLGLLTANKPADIHRLFKIDYVGNDSQGQPLSLHYERIDALTALRELKAQDWTRITPEIMTYLPAWLIRSIPVAAIPYLQPSVFSVMTHEQLGNGQDLSIDEYISLYSDRLLQLNYATGDESVEDRYRALGFQSPTKLEFYRAALLKHLATISDRSNQNGFSTAQLAQLTAEQFSQINPEFLTRKILGAVSIDTFKGGMTLEQIKRLSEYMLNTTKVNPWNDLDPSAPDYHVRFTSLRTQLADLVATIMQGDRDGDGVIDIDSQYYQTNQDGTLALDENGDPIELDSAKNYDPDGREKWLVRSMDVLRTLNWLDPSYANLVGIQQVNNNDFAGLNWSWMSAEFLNALSDETFSRISALNVGQLNLNALRGVSAEKVSLLTGLQIQSLSGEQISALGNINALNSSQIQSIDRSALRNLQVSLGNLSNFFLQSLSTSQWGVLSAQMLAQLSQEELQASRLWREDGWAQTDTYFFNHLSSDAFGVLCRETINGETVTPKILSAPAEVLSGLNPERLSLLAIEARNYSGENRKALYQQLLSDFTQAEARQALQLVQSLPELDREEGLIIMVGLLHQLGKIESGFDQHTHAMGLVAGLQALSSLQITSPDLFNLSTLRGLFELIPSKPELLTNALSGNHAMDTYNLSLLENRLSSKTASLHEKSLGDMVRSVGRINWEEAIAKTYPKGHQGAWTSLDLRNVVAQVRFEFINQYAGFIDSSLMAEVEQHFISLENKLIPSWDNEDPMLQFNSTGGSSQAIAALLSHQSQLSLLLLPTIESYAFGDEMTASQTAGNTLYVHYLLARELVLANADRLGNLENQEELQTDDTIARQISAIMSALGEALGASDSLSRVSVYNQVVNWVANRGRNIFKAYDDNPRAFPELDLVSLARQRDLVVQAIRSDKLAKTVDAVMGRTVLISATGRVQVVGADGHNNLTARLQEFTMPIPFLDEPGNVQQQQVVQLNLESPLSTSEKATAGQVVRSMIERGLIALQDGSVPFEVQDGRTLLTRALSKEEWRYLRQQARSLYASDAETNRVLRAAGIDQLSFRQDFDSVFLTQNNLLIEVNFGAQIKSLRQEMGLKQVKTGLIDLMQTVDMASPQSAGYNRLLFNIGRNVKLNASEMAYLIGIPQSKSELAAYLREGLIKTLGIAVSSDGELSANGGIPLLRMDVTGERLTLNTLVDESWTYLSTKYASAESIDPDDFIKGFVQQVSRVGLAINEEGITWRAPNGNEFEAIELFSAPAHGMERAIRLALLKSNQISGLNNLTQQDADMVARVTISFADDFHQIMRGYLKSFSQQSAIDVQSYLLKAEGLLREFGVNPKTSPNASNVLTKLSSAFVYDQMSGILLGSAPSGSSIRTLLNIAKANPQALSEIGLAQLVNAWVRAAYSDTEVHQFNHSEALLNSVTETFKVLSLYDLENPDISYQTQRYYESRRNDLQEIAQEAYVTAQLRKIAKVQTARTKIVQLETDGQVNVEATGAQIRQYYEASREWLRQFTQDPQAVYEGSMEQIINRILADEMAEGFARSSTLQNEYTQIGQAGKTVNANAFTSQTEQSQARLSSVLKDIFTSSASGLTDVNEAELITLTQTVTARWVAQAGGNAALENLPTQVAENFRAAAISSLEATNVALADSISRVARVDLDADSRKSLLYAYKHGDRDIEDFDLGAFLNQYSRKLNQDGINGNDKPILYKALMEMADYEFSKIYLNKILANDTIGYTRADTLRAVLRHASAIGLDSAFVQDVANRLAFNSFDSWGTSLGAAAYNAYSEGLQAYFKAGSSEMKSFVNNALRAHMSARLQTFMLDRIKAEGYQYFNILEQPDSNIANLKTMGQAKFTSLVNQMANQFNQEIEAALDAVMKINGYTDRQIELSAEASQGNLMQARQAARTDLLDLINEIKQVPLSPSSDNVSATDVPSSRFAAQTQTKIIMKANLDRILSRVYGNGYRYWGDPDDSVGVRIQALKNLILNPNTRDWSYGIETVQLMYQIQTGDKDWDPQEALFAEISRTYKDKRDASSIWNIQKMIDEGIGGTARSEFNSENSDFKVNMRNARTLDLETDGLRLRKALWRNTAGSVPADNPSGSEAGRTAGLGSLGVTYASVFDSDSSGNRQNPLRVNLRPEVLQERLQARLVQLEGLESTPPQQVARDARSLANRGYESIGDDAEGQNSAILSVLSERMRAGSDAQEYLAEETVAYARSRVDDALSQSAMRSPRDDIYDVPTPRSVQGDQKLTRAIVNRAAQLMRQQVISQSDVISLLAKATTQMRQIQDIRYQAVLKQQIDLLQYAQVLGNPLSS